MHVHPDRRTRREARRNRIATVTAACALSIVAAIVAVSCRNVAASPDATASGPSSATRYLRAVPVRSARATLDAMPTTTTTTRPVVNPDTGPPPTGTGSGRRIVYCNSCQTVWLVDDDEFVAAMYKVSGHRGMPAPGLYSVFRKLDMGRSKAHPDLRLPFFVGFAWGNTTDIGFHGIPLRPDGSQIQSDDQLGIPLSSGCVRESQLTAKLLYDWAPLDTLVVVTA